MPLQPGQAVDLSESDQEDSGVTEVAPPTPPTPPAPTSDSENRDEEEVEDVSSEERPGFSGYTTGPEEVKSSTDSEKEEDTPVRPAPADFQLVKPSERISP